MPTNLNLDTEQLKQKLEEAKQKLGEGTEKFEKATKDFFNQISPNYSNLEPWKRGLILLGLSLGTVVIIYWLTSNDDQKAQREAKKEEIREQKLIKRLELLKNLQR